MKFEEILKIITENEKYNNNYKNISKKRQQEMFDLVGKRLEQTSHLKKLKQFQNIDMKDWVNYAENIVKKIAPDKPFQKADALAVKKALTTDGEDVAKMSPELSNEVLRNDIHKAAGLNSKRNQLNYQERGLKSMQRLQASKRGNLGDLDNLDVARDNYYITFNNGIIRPNDNSRSYGMDGLVKIKNNVYFVENKITEEMTRQTDRSLITFVESCKAVGVIPVIVCKDKNNPVWEKTIKSCINICPNTKIFSASSFTSWININKCLTFKKSVEKGSYILDNLKKYLGNKVDIGSEKQTTTTNTNLAKDIRKTASQTINKPVSNAIKSVAESLS